MRRGEECRLCRMKRNLESYGMGKDSCMRRFLCGTLAGLLMGAGGLQAQVPPPPPPPALDPPQQVAPPQPPSQQRQSFYPSPGMDEQRFQSPQYYGQPDGPGYYYGQPRAPMMGGFPGGPMMRGPAGINQPESLPMPRPDPSQPGYDPRMEGFNLGGYGPQYRDSSDSCWNGSGER